MVLILFGVLEQFLIDNFSIKITQFENTRFIGK